MVEGKRVWETGRTEGKDMVEGKRVRETGRTGRKGHG